MSSTPREGDKAGSIAAAALSQALRFQFEAEFEALSPRLEGLPTLQHPFLREREWSEGRYKLGPFPSGAGGMSIDYYLRPEVTDEDRHLPHRLWSLPDPRVSWLKGLAAAAADILSLETGHPGLVVGIFGPGPLHKEPSIRVSGVRPHSWERTARDGEQDAALQHRARELIGEVALALARALAGTGCILQSAGSPLLRAEPAPIAWVRATPASIAGSAQATIEALHLRLQDCERLRENGPSPPD